MGDREDIAVFEEARPRLLGLAYRILGSRADAEDAVQDTFLKWRAAEQDAIANPGAWLMTTCTRRCIDLLRAAHRARVDYVGTWLPEPIHTVTEASQDAALGASLTTAFLLMLERLTPKERAAYLLHEIFDMDYPDIARALDMREAACRKLVSRAKGHVEAAKVRHVTPAARQEELLAAFETAVAGGGTTALVALLSDDIELGADGGGKVSAASHILRGMAEVVGFIDKGLRMFWAGYQMTPTDINGTRGFVLHKDDHLEAAVSFAYDEDGRLSGIYIMRNPDKLARLDAMAIR